MHRLIRRFRDVRRGRERGAVAVLVTILLGSGVLLTAGALVVDVGGAYAERAQLQSGADSAALAVGGACAVGASACTTATQRATTAGQFADANANDGTSAVTAICGQDGSGALPSSCPAMGGALPGCGPTPSPGTDYAEVHTATRTSSGSRFLPPVFGRAVLGSSYPGMQMGACARASWGPPLGGTGMGLTVSYCEWLAAVGGDASAPHYAPPPPAQPDPKDEIVIYFHGDDPNPTQCVAPQSGFDVPGDFGSLLTAPGTCSAVFDFDPDAGPTSYDADPGSSLSAACQQRLADATSSHEIVYLPIYDQVTGTGTGASYTLWNMAAFVITGYYWPNWNADSWLTGHQACGGTGRCISGYFTTAVIPGIGSVVRSGPGAGVYAVRLVN